MADGNITVEVSTQAAQAELERLRAENARLAFENDQLRRKVERLQKLLTAVHQIAEELARPSGI